MLRRSFLTVAAALVVASCGATTAPPALGPDGKPLPRAYRIPSGSSAEIEYSMLDSVNALRQARGVSPLTLNAKLNAAAATHSRDMSVQNRPWHFGSDGSSPAKGGDSRPMPSGNPEACTMSWRSSPWGDALGWMAAHASA